MSFQLAGYENLELSTQVLVKAALDRGISVEVLDAADNFVRLTKGDVQEYVRNGNQTSKDSYITSLIMDNKLVTKKILQEHNVRVPAGTDVHSLDEAATAYNQFAGKDIIIKPRSTNYGIGIHRIYASDREEVFLDAAKEALTHDDSVIVEEFIEGDEYRFLVIGYEVRAVLHRVPANVTGDGISTIEQLVEEKNKHPFRGKGYKTPLEYIQLGEDELAYLAHQNLNTESIPKQGEQIFLRSNSNISTGGDSIDFTDKVHPDYKKIALQAAQAVDAKISGVDMMIQDVSVKPDDNYAIIELNWNPVLYFHNFPMEGKNRDVGKYVIDLLFGKD